MAGNWFRCDVDALWFLVGEPLGVKGAYYEIIRYVREKAPSKGWVPIRSADHLAADMGIHRSDRPCLTRLIEIVHELPLDGEPLQARPFTIEPGRLVFHHWWVHQSPDARRKAAERAAAESKNPGDSGFVPDKPENSVPEWALWAVTEMQAIPAVKRCKGASVQALAERFASQIQKHYEAYGDEGFRAVVQRVIDVSMADPALGERATFAKSPTALFTDKHRRAATELQYNDAKAKPSPKPVEPIAGRDFILEETGSGLVKLDPRTRAAFDETAWRAQHAS